MSAQRWHGRRRGPTRLWCLDIGAEQAPPIVLLHGLAGYAAEWHETASWLASGHRVVALEQRGHGRSERRPDDVSRQAFVADAEAWLEWLGLGSVVVAGQSLGGHTAFLLAARRPDLVRGLVVVEATPEVDRDAPKVVRSWLESWPVPFASRERAADFFGGDTLRARTWAGGLEQRDGGLWPAFEIDTMVAALEEVSSRSYWDRWRAVRCPALVFRHADGPDREVYREMVATAPNAGLAEIEDAGHDLHLDQPDRWRARLSAFLDELGPPAPP
jgi:pimeloyl-ACP methyl ester carboxylesterase